ncbi:MAG TPA: aminotransferase class III-fold pyridoxal phosphate-dependent enzyme, partial [Limnochordia bacterium]|nr:aminotransferase class III-fold pyridoxal phosphate-dependent enzyme [Limnochordia bacterium]
MNDAKLRFARHIAWTSPAPAGLVVERAAGCRIWARPADAPPGSERDYLDLLAGIGVMNAGHSAPRVVAAISAQAQRYLHTMVYGEHLQAPQIALAEAVAVRAGGPLSTLYFTSSGAEAIEGSIKLARKATGRTKLVAAMGAYHGDTTGALSLGGDAAHRRPFEPLLPGVERIPFGAFDAFGAIDRDTALVVVEPIQAEAGVVAPPAGWLAALRAR